MYQNQSNSDNFSFPSGRIHLNFNTSAIIGACRSGKTTLGNIITTFKNVENAEEPWTAKLLPLTAGLGLIQKEIALEMFVAYVTELFNEVIFMRRANFRPADLSCIWAQKEHEEIYHRLTNLLTRDDVKIYKKINQPLLLLNLTEVVPFVDFLLEALPKVKLIYVVREGLDVASDCLNKGWFSDSQLHTPIKALPYKTVKFKDQIWHIPWWVESGYEENFLALNEFDRCVYYWCQTNEAGYKQISDPLINNQCIFVNYSDILENTDSTLDYISSFLGISRTPMTDYALAKLRNRKYKSNRRAISNRDLMERYKQLSEKLFYCNSN